MTVFVAVYGDANSVTVWSGTPFYLLDGLRRNGVAAEGMVLEPRARPVRALWNLAQLVTTGGYSGFQYSETGLRPLWRAYHKRLRGQAVINCGQIYPSSILRDPAIRRWYFIDATIRQLMEGFVDYNGPPKLAARQLTRLYRKERCGYEQATGVICHSSWTANSVINDYGIDPSKVHIVVPGANLDLDHYANWRLAHAGASTRDGPLRLVFTGRYPDRKGLDRLLQAMRIAQERGALMHLTVIGCTREDIPEELRDTKGVDWLGTINKQVEADRFNDLVASAEVGCLLSRHECGGIGLREYAAFGLIVLGPNVGGSPEHAGRQRSVLIGRDETPERIAEQLVLLASRGERYQRLRVQAQASMDEALNIAAASQIADLISSG